MEFWLAGLSVEQVRARLAPVLGDPKLRAVLDQSWSKQPSDRRFTIPPRVKRDLCRLAVSYVEVLHDAQETARGTDRYQDWLRVADAIERTLQFNGVQTGSSSRHRVRPKDWKKPDLNRVLRIVNRRAPPGTLRRKARLRRKIAD
jgi:hypothetical protein